IEGDLAEAGAIVADDLAIVAAIHPDRGERAIGDMVGADDDAAGPVDVDAVSILSRAARYGADPRYPVAADQRPVMALLRLPDEQAVVVTSGNGIAGDDEAAAVQREQRRVAAMGDLVVLDAPAASAEPQARPGARLDPAIGDQQVVDAVEI